MLDSVINTKLLAHPLNWVSVGLVLVIWAMVLHVVHPSSAMNAGDQTATVS